MKALLPLALLLEGMAISAPSVRASSHEGEESAAAALEAVERAYEAFEQRQDPITGANAQDAQGRGEEKVTDPTRNVAIEGFVADLEGIDASKLPFRRREDLALLKWMLEARIDQLRFDEARMPFSSEGGFQLYPNYEAWSFPVRNRADIEKWITRLDAMAGYYEAHIEGARRGARSGFTQPRIVVEQVIATATATANAAIEGDPLLSPFARLPVSIPASDRAALRTRAEGILAEKIRPAQRRFVQFLKEEYLPKARPTLGLSGVPNGRPYYAWLVGYHTTTGLTPDQVHDMGLGEVARIRAEMEKVIDESGFDGDFESFQTFLRTDPRFYASSREDLLEKASEVAKRIDDHLPAYFGTLPRLTFSVRPVPAAIEEEYSTGRYFPGDPETGVAGGYIVNTSHLDQRPLYELPSLTLHEASPGHHLQIALQQELKDLPYQRRKSYVNAFTEGWGLYSESLGLEWGIYRDAYEKFGKLSFEMWRACRLVADTGLHWKNWTLEQARACFVENTALASHNIETELKRYISWPGQALSYKIGEIRIKELRAKGEAALGDTFDIRAFHDILLGGGPLPLDLLEIRIDDWIARALAGAEAKQDMATDATGERPAP